jgi:membrane dipeptidase
MMALIPIFDGHNDTLTRLYSPDGEQSRSFFERSDQGHLDLPRAKAGGLCGGIFAIFTPPTETSPEHDPFWGLTFTEDGYDLSPRSPIDHHYAKTYTDSVADYLYDLVKNSDGQLAVVRSYRNLIHNFDRGNLSAVLHFEGAEAIHEDLSDLETYYARGLRSLGLVWSRPNVFGHGVPFRFPHSPDTVPGLTAAGKKLVQACNRLGILVDLSHINEKGFWDVAELSDAPLVVSHAGVYAICPSTRNLTDKQIDAVGQSNGLIGVIFEPVNTRPDGRPGDDTPLTEIVRHIRYVADRVGINHVALGSDFDGADVPEAMRDVSGLPNLIQVLHEDGFDDESLEKIAYRNWFRILKDTWK